MELLQMVYFRKVAELQSMSKAAEEMHIVQSAMSRSIARLEEELGVNLFDRKGRGIVLNEHGRIAYDRVDEILSRIGLLKEDLKRSKERACIRLSIEAASALIPGLLAKYKTLYPETEFIINQQEKGDDYDLLLTSEPYNVKGQNLEVVFKECVKVLVPCTFRDRIMSDSISVKDLETYPFIGLRAGSGLRELTDKILSSKGINIHYAFESDNPNLLRSMMDSGLGLVFYPEKSWGSFDSERFHLLDIEGVNIMRNIVLKADLSQKRVECFYTFMKDELSKLNE